MIAQVLFMYILMFYFLPGNDGGDCDLEHLSCDSSDIKNGQCDFECNRYYHNWDGDDCCDPAITDTSKNCFDPSSPHR